MRVLIVGVSLQFMDLRTRYTALVTLTTQHVKYISDALRRLEEEEVTRRCYFTVIHYPRHFTMRN